MSGPVTRQEQLLSAIATGGDIISPITREEMYLAYLAGDTSVVLPEPITRKEQFLYQACLNGGGGGTEITDGIVVKARDADGYATEVDLYCADNTVQINQFRSGNSSNQTPPTPYYKLTKINTKNTVDKVKEYAFAWLTSLTDLNIDFKNLVSIGSNAFIGCKALSVDVALNNLTSDNAATCFSFSGITSLSAPLFTSVPNSFCYKCPSLKNVYFPKATRVGVYTSKCCMGSTALETAEFGSVGFGVTGWGSSNFDGCTQAGLTITMYTTGEKADALLADIRNGATNATIILKASEDTTYNGVAYAAGETMITSTVEAAT